MHPQGTLPHFRGEAGGSHDDSDELEDFTAFEAGLSTAYSSPAIPTVFDLPVDANLGTVSPQDLLIQDPYMSAPNSSALTSLTSPSPYESPDFGDNYNVSPNFGSCDFDTGPNETWFPLFPQETGVQSSIGTSQSPAEKADELEVVELTSGVGRRKSGHSPISGRHSSVSGVNSRRRDKPLPPIIVENPDDIVAMKRARNTLAARKSRERKVMRFEELEEKIQKLEAERDHWKDMALARGAN